MSDTKFASNYEPNQTIVTHAFDLGYYRLSRADGTVVSEPINGRWLKYFCVKQSIHYV